MAEQEGRINGFVDISVYDNEPLAQLFTGEIGSVVFPISFYGSMAEDDLKKKYPEK